jgi:carbamoylphosphate synthase small subunit
MKATLALENGLWYEGEACGAPGETGGEVVFNTSMTGYQEVLTDPSYAGQIVTMTAPEMGLRHPPTTWNRAHGSRIHRRRGVADRQQLAVGERGAARLPGQERIVAISNIGHAC